MESESRKTHVNHANTGSLVSWAVLSREPTCVNLPRQRVATLYPWLFLHVNNKDTIVTLGALPTAAGRICSCCCSAAGVIVVATQAVLNTQVRLLPQTAI